METIAILDHGYSRHWSESYKTDHSHAKPIQWILPTCSKNPHALTSRIKSQHISVPAKSNSSSDGSEDEIDVESLDEVMSPYMPGRSYDVQKARFHMNETQRFTTHTLTSGKGAQMRSEADWEEYINKSGWSMLQNKLFSKVLKVLEDEKLARLAFKGVNNEPIARRLSLDRSTACLRRIFAEFAWDLKLTQWIHSLLTSRLPAAMLASYLDLIQTLRSKVPTLVERMIMQSTSETVSTTPGTLNILLKRPWEPTLLKYPLTSGERLYDPPIILFIPNSPFASSPTMAHRKRLWNSHLSQLGKVVAVASPEKSPGMTILSYIEQLALTVRSKINMYKNKYPRRSIVLAGWHNASILSCHISLVEKVAIILCLGFPTQTLNGPRGTVDDVFCDMMTPTLFVVGEEADSCDIDKIEDFREKLLTRCENRLLAVPGADDALRVSDKVKKKSCVTQQMADRMILDHIAKFFSETLIMNIGKWHVTESVPDFDVSTSRHHSKYEGRRKRQNSDEREIAEIKRRRLPSATTAKISQILSGQSSSKGRDGARTPVQGVTYNLQTGSISGLANVPNVLNRSLSKSNEAGQSLKGKGSARNRNQPRSITIDLAKDTASQIKRGSSFGVSPDPSLLATGSQTEAAVATILGSDFASPRDKTTASSSDQNNASLAKSPALATSASSAFTRISTASSSSLPSSQTPTTSHAASAHDTISQYHAPKPKPAFANVKFQSTTLQKQISQTDTGTLSTINKQHWAGILDSSVSVAVTKTDFPRKYPYLPPASVTDNASHITSRSRKEERETMQATAILEQLTSGIGNDTEQNNQPGSSGAASTLYRRHSYDSTFYLDGAGRGRGRVRTRGGSTAQSPLTREGPQRRRKTLHEERTPPTSTVSYYQQHLKQSQPIKQGSFVRYVVNRNASSAISDAAAKASKQTSVTIATATSRNESAKAASKAASKASILPIYTFTQPAATSSIKIQNLASPVTAAKTGTVTTMSKMTSGVSPSPQAVAAKKPSKVIVGQRLPVKFPGAVPGSSYTFVTIPALTGPPLPAVGQKGTVKRIPSYPTKIKKYSVVPRNVTVLTSPVAASKVTRVTAKSPSTAPVSVTLRNKALPKTGDVKLQGSAQPVTRTVVKSTASLPVFTSPSVVLHKLWSETVAEMGEEGSNSNAKAKK